MKKILLLLSLCLSLLAEDIVVFENEYNVLALDKKVKKLIVGNKEILNVSLLTSASNPKTTLKLFGKKSGNTSILIMYRDKSIQNYHVYVNQNLGFIQKMVNVIEPNIHLNRVGDGSTVVAGSFQDPHEKSRVYSLLESAGIDMTKLMDITRTKKVNKMVRTKLYLVEINNQKAKDLGGVVGLGYFDEFTNILVNAQASTGATFSGFLLDHTGNYIAQTGNSITSTLNFLESKGIAKILDDTVLITTEDKNASFHVGGEVYIPVGLTQNIGMGPTIQLEEKEYGLRLTLTSKFMQKDNFMHMDIEIKDSEFDTNHEHDVQLGEFTVVPSFISKNIKTDIVAKSGQVIALGGRLHSEEMEAEEKIPLLGDIPLIGALFTRTVTKAKDNDLLFFLVPEIVDANENLDDSNFYQDFKDENNALHSTILNMQSQEEGTLVVMEDRALLKKIVEVQEDIVFEDTVIETESPSITVASTEEELDIQVQESIETNKKEPEKIRAEVEEVNKVEVIETEVTSVPKQEEVIHLEEVSVLTNEVLSNPVKEEQEVAKVVEKEISVSQDFVVEVIDSIPEELENTSNNKLIQKTKIKEEKLQLSTKLKILEKSKQTINKKYKVATTKIFLREKPVDGKRSQVWIQGHEFLVEKEKNISGSPWLKVIEDCFDKCEKLESSLWIAKKYTEEL